MTIDRNADKQWEIFQIPMFGGKESDLLKKIELVVNEKRSRYWIATVNPEFVVLTWSNKLFAEILMNQTSLNVVDGVGIVWAREVLNRSKNNNIFSKLINGIKVGGEILGGKYKDEILAGSDLIDSFCGLAAKENKNVYFLGGYNGAAKKTAEYFSKKYKNLKVEGYYEGDSLNDVFFINEIKDKRVDFLFIAYGMKTQEDWVKRNLSKINAGVVMGVGRSFDYYSGQLKRAPKLWRKMGFEWLYSLIKQPSRWRRQLSLLKFLGRVLFGKQ